MSAVGRWVWVAVADGFAVGRTGAGWPGARALTARLAAGVTWRVPEPGAGDAAVGTTVAPEPASDVVAESADGAVLLLDAVGAAALAAGAALVAEAAAGLLAVGVDAAVEAAGAAELS
jgi:hypothetical protein